MTRRVEVVSLRDALAGVSEAWSPRLVGEVSGFHANVVKLRGEFAWHHHENEDELFLVLAGTMTMRLGNREPGESREP